MNNPPKFDPNQQKSARLQELYSSGAGLEPHQHAANTHQQLRDEARQHQQQVQQATDTQVAERTSSRHMTHAQIREALQQHKTSQEQFKEQAQQITRTTRDSER